MTRRRIGMFIFLGILAIAAIATGLSDRRLWSQWRKVYLECQEVIVDSTLRVKDTTLVDFVWPDDSTFVKVYGEQANRYRVSALGSDSDSVYYAIRCSLAEDANWDSIGGGGIDTIIVYYVKGQGGVVSGKNAVVKETLFVDFIWPDDSSYVRMYAILVENNATVGDTLFTDFIRPQDSSYVNENRIGSLDTLIFYTADGYAFRNHSGDTLLWITSNEGVTRDTIFVPDSVIIWAKHDIHVGRNFWAGMDTLSSTGLYFNTNNIGNGLWRWVSFNNSSQAVVGVRYNAAAEETLLLGTIDGAWNARIASEEVYLTTLAEGDTTGICMMDSSGDTMSTWDADGDQRLFGSLTIEDSAKVGGGTFIKKIVTVGSHLAIITSGDDTMWAATDTTNF